MLKKTLKLLKKICFGFLILFTSLALVGFLYEHISRSNVEQDFPPSGKLVDVGGHKLHFVKKGTGGPTVVFESGADPGGHLPWRKVQDELSKHTTTLSYDRAGILWSERGHNPRTGKAIARELHTLLEKSGLKKPYILVGHSLAGLTLRSFIKNYPEEVAGIVFVDASHPDMLNRFSREMKLTTWTPPLWFVNFTNAIGLSRILYGNFAYPGSRKNAPMNIRFRALQFKGTSATVEEMQNLKHLSREASLITSFGNTPLIIITGASPDRNKLLPTKSMRREMTELWPELQKDLLKLSSNSRQILATKSAHYVQLEQPEIVIDSVKELLSVAP